MPDRVVVAHRDDECKVIGPITSMFDAWIVLDIVTGLGWTGMIVPLTPPPSWS